MRDFTRLYLDLDETTATSEKVAILERYFESADEADAAWAVALIAGERPKGAASTRVLRELVREVSGHPKWLVDESYAAVGDLSEAVALLIPDVGDGHESPPLAEVMRRFVQPLARCKEHDKRELIREAWRLFGADERFVYHKLIRGGFRIGVGKKLLTRALASVAGVDPAVMAHRLAGRVEPVPAFYRALFDPSDGDDAARPYPFFLAHQLEGDVRDLGDRSDWQAEWKWDGVRAQLIHRAGGVALWSRGEELVTPAFPEIGGPAASLPEGTVLDGEILMRRGDRPLPFSELQKRLNRVVAPQLGLFETDRPAFCAYDLLEDGGVDLRDRPLAERRERLEAILGSADGSALYPSAILDAASWDELERLRDESVARGAEGIMLKRLDAPYGVGRTKGADRAAAWIKWKVDPCAVDAVMLYAQLGSGRRASLYTDYTFGVWAPGDDGQRELVPFAKAYSGLTNEEIERVDRWIRRNSVSRAGPVRMVKPEQVFEIGFEGIRASGRHRSGVAVRFPRILRWRTDKTPAEADAIETLHALIEERAW